MVFRGKTLGAILWNGAYMNDGITMRQVFLKTLDEKTRHLSMEYGFEGIIALSAENEVLFERRWIDDYHRDIYSNTKSFTSAAVGMAIHDGILDIDARPVDFFSQSPNQSGSFLDELTLKDLLTMRSGFGKPLLMYFDRRAGIGARDYVSYIMSQPLVKRPGSQYLYSTADSILAGCMVEKACGTSLLTYLQDKFFSLAQIDYPIWESDLLGHSCGGSGLHLKLRDMTKLGVLYLNGGMYDGVRLFPEEWVDQSFYPHVVTNRGYVSWGYGYFWKISTDQKVYRASGSFGQDTLVIPSLDLVIGVQCREGTRAAEMLHDEVRAFIAKNDEDIAQV